MLLNDFVGSLQLARASRSLPILWWTLTTHYTSCLDAGLNIWGRYHMCISKIPWAGVPYSFNSRLLPPSVCIIFALWWGPWRNKATRFIIRYSYARRCFFSFHYHIILLCILPSRFRINTFSIPIWTRRRALWRTKKSASFNSTGAKCLIFKIKDFLLYI